MFLFSREVQKLCVHPRRGDIGAVEGRLPFQCVQITHLNLVSLGRQGFTRQVFQCTIEGARFRVGIHNQDIHLHFLKTNDACDSYA